MDSALFNSPACTRFSSIGERRFDAGGGTMVSAGGVCAPPSGDGSGWAEELLVMLCSFVCMFWLMTTTQRSTDGTARNIRRKTCATRAPRAGDRNELRHLIEHLADAAPRQRHGHRIPPCAPITSRKEMADLVNAVVITPDGETSSLNAKRNFLAHGAFNSPAFLRRKMNLSTSSPARLNRRA